MSQKPIDRGVTRRDTLMLLGASTFAGAASAPLPATADELEIKRVVLGQAKGAGQSAQFPLAIGHHLFDQGLDEKKHGLDEKKIGLIHMTAPEQIPAFITGDIDGLICWEPWLWIATQKVPGAHVLQRASGLSKTYNLLLASDQYITKYPNTVKAVLRGLVKANDQIQTADSQARAAQLVHQSEMPDIATDVLLSMMKQRTFTMMVDQPLIDDLQKMTDFLFSIGRINQRVEVREWLRPALLREVRPELVKVSV